MKRMEGATHGTGDDVPTCKSTHGSPSCRVSHAFLVEVCIEFVGDASAAKAEEEQAEDVDG